MLTKNQVWRYNAKTESTGKLVSIFLIRFFSLKRAHSFFFHQFSREETSLNIQLKRVIPSLPFHIHLNTHYNMPAVLIDVSLPCSNHLENLPEEVFSPLKIFFLFFKMLPLIWICFSTPFASSFNIWISSEPYSLCFVVVGLAVWRAVSPGDLLCGPWGGRMIKGRRDPCTEILGFHFYLALWVCDVQLTRR